MLKKGSSSRSALPKSAKKCKGVATSIPPICYDIIPYGEVPPPIGNIVLEESPMAKTQSTKKSVVVKSKPPPPRWPSNAPPSSKRKASSKVPIAQFKRRVCLLNHFFPSLLFMDFSYIVIV